MNIRTHSPSSIGFSLKILLRVFTSYFRCHWN